MKVSEAKEKICPFMSDNTMGRDYNGNYNGVSYCVCSDCMAWVYTKEVKHDDIIETKITLDLNEDKSEITEQHELIDERMIGLALSRTYGIPKKLSEDDKEGYCKRLSNDN